MSNEENEHHHHGPDHRKPDSTKPEIRYVPLDIRAIENEDDEINIFEVFKTLWDGRKTIIKTVAVFAVIGLFIALISIEEYTSSVKVLPESEPGISLGALGGIAQQFGFSSVPQQSGEEISPNIYPAIIQSNIFVQELMDYEVPIPNGTDQISLDEYVGEFQSGSIIQFILRLPFKIKKWLISLRENEITTFDKAIGDPEKVQRLVQMSNEDWETLRNIRDRITTSIDTETGVVTISAKMQDPMIAAAVADEVVQKLSGYITEKRTEKARRELEFIEDRFEEAKVRFEQAQEELAEFNDQNRGQLTAMARTEEQLLQSRYNLNFNLYNSMAERLEEARIKLQEETPVITILEPAAVPDRRSEPQRTLLVIVFTVLGGIVGLGIVTLKPFLQTLRNKLQ